MRAILGLTWFLFLVVACAGVPEPVLAPQLHPEVLHAEDHEPKPGPFVPMDTADMHRPDWSGAEICETSNGLIFVFEGKVLGGCDRWEKMALDAEDMAHGLFEWGNLHGTHIYVRKSEMSFACGNEYPAVGCTWFEPDQRVQGVKCSDETCITQIVETGYPLLHELFHRMGWKGHKKWGLIGATELKSVRSIQYLMTKETLHPFVGSILDRDIEYSERWHWWNWTD